jgi:fumarate hydratase class II
MDATPLTLGQECSGYARQAAKAVELTDKAVAALREIAVGGTAVGTGHNGHPEFAAKVYRILREQTGLPLVEASSHFEARTARPGVGEGWRFLMIGLTSYHYRARSLVHTKKPLP